MLTIHTLKSAGDAKKYYEVGDYYAKDGKANDSSEWFGKGADLLKLKNNVDFEVFQKVLEGKLPDGNVMLGGYDKKGNPKHRPGYDLTFSAPKSLSVLALVGGDERLLQAHDAAVRATLDHIERKVIATRTKKQGKINFEKTKNLTAALFRHTDSRKLDPNIHTHCILANATKFQESWRTLYGDDFYQSTLELGFRYRNELVQVLRDLGYEITRKGDNGLFEIKGIPDDIVKLYSKRRAEIESKLEELENDGAKAASVANFLTRSKKTTIELNIAKEYWLKELAQNGFSLDCLEQIIEASKVRGPIEPPDLQEVAKNSMQLALDDLKDRAAVFPVEKLVYTANTYALGSDVPASFLLNALEENIKGKDFLYVGDGLVTSRQAVEAENKLINTVISQNNSWQMVGFGSKFIANYMFDGNFQQETAAKLMSTKDRVVIIQAENYQAIQVFLPRFYQGIKSYAFVHDLHLTNKGLEKFSKNTGVESKNLYSFLKYADKLIARKNEGSWLPTHNNIWVIHKSHQLGTEKMQEIVNKANILDAKVVLVGDTQQREGFSHGLPIDYLKKYCTTVKTQDTRDITIEDVNKILDSLEKNNILYEIKENDELLTTAVNWQTQERGVLFTTNAVEQEQLNCLVREKLKENKVLLGNALLVNSLQEVYLSNSQKNLLSSYCLGDLIYFGQNGCNSFAKGSYWEVVGVDEEKNELIMHANGESKIFSLTKSSTKGIKTFRIEKNELMVGDFIVCTKNENNKEARRLMAGDFAKVIAVDLEKQKLTIQTEKKVIRELSLDKLKKTYLKNIIKVSDGDYFDKSTIKFLAEDTKLTPKKVENLLQEINQESKINN